MKYLIDAQITYKLGVHLRKKGIDIKHVSELPKKDYSTDEEIIEIAEMEDRVVITKDLDFLNSYLVMHRPNKLLYITTGNIKNNELIDIIDRCFLSIDDLMLTHNLIELNRYEFIVH